MQLSRHAAVAKAIDYVLTRFLDDGRICISNNDAERALHTLAFGRKSWSFAGSERGAERAAVMNAPIHTAVSPRRLALLELVRLCALSKSRLTASYAGFQFPQTNFFVAEHDADIPNDDFRPPPPVSISVTARHDAERKGAFRVG
jgi:hypothetical protein